MELPLLIRSLLDPARHGADVAQVDLVETHISWVLLAGAYAYKIKKPITLPFLDFSTLALRKHFCEEELRLNQRFAPDIYLEVVGLYHSEADPQWHGTGEPLEYAVKMRRFDQDARLDHVCARGGLTPELVSDLAHRVATLHASAAQAAPEAGLGTPALVRAQTLENFDDLHTMLGQHPVQQRLQALRAWTLQQHAQLAPLMQTRLQQGMVRECHGDLHLANMVLLDQSVRLFDCLEFKDTLRWIDTTSDIAFTYQDMLAHGKPGLANWFMNEVLEASGDYGAAPLLRFYAVYRALVRAKVAAVHYLQHGEPLEHTLQCVALAEQIAVAQPLRLLITHGVSGCGKTYRTSQMLQDDGKAPMLRLRSDVERKRLFHLPALGHSSSGLHAGLYSAAANAATYAHLSDTADALLRAGWSVVVDGTFLHRSQRDVFAQLAQTHQARFGILAPTATEEALRSRVQARTQRGDDASEASLEVLQSQLAVQEPIEADEPVWPTDEQPAPSLPGGASLR